LPLAKIGYSIPNFSVRTVRIVVHPIGLGPEGRSWRVSLTSIG
jgi:hypothetical protein